MGVGQDASGVRVRGSIQGKARWGAALFLLLTFSGRVALAAAPSATEASAPEGSVDRYVARALDGTPAVRCPRGVAEGRPPEAKSPRNVART